MNKLVCPVCQSKYELQEAATTAALKEMVGLAARFGKVWGMVEEYVETFRASQWGSITIKKRVRLLNEMSKLWETGEFEYNGKRYRADRAGIRAAINTVCNADKFGFKNHNYLKAILKDGAKRVSASGHTAGEEQKRETSRGQRTEDRGQTADDGDTVITAEEFKSRKGIKSLADQIGVMP